MPTDTPSTMPSIMRRLRPLSLAAALTLGVACDDSNGGTAPSAVASVRAQLMSAALRVGDTVTLQAVATDQDGVPIPGARLAWSSSPGGVVAVGPGGRIRGTVPGATWVRVSAGSASDSVGVNVGENAAVLEQLDPAPGTVLQPGTPVTIAGRIRYALTSTSSGQLLMVVQDQGTDLLQFPQPSVAITAGGGTISMTDTIEIPATGVSKVQVFFALQPSGANGTTTVTSAYYPVQ